MVNTIPKPYYFPRFKKKKKVTEKEADNYCGEKGRDQYMCWI